MKIWWKMQERWGKPEPHRQPARCQEVSYQRNPSLWWETASEQSCPYLPANAQLCWWQHSKGHAQLFVSLSLAALDPTSSWLAPAVTSKTLTAPAVYCLQVFPWSVLSLMSHFGFMRASSIRASGSIKKDTIKRGEHYSIPSCSYLLLRASFWLAFEQGNFCDGSSEVWSKQWRWVVFSWHYKAFLCASLKLRFWAHFCNLTFEILLNE